MNVALTAESVLLTCISHKWTTYVPLEYSVVPALRGHTNKAGISNELMSWEKQLISPYEIRFSVLINDQFQIATSFPGL